MVTELIRRIRKKMKMYSEHEYIATYGGGDINGQNKKSFVKEKPLFCI